MLDNLFNAEIVWTERDHRDEVLKQTTDKLASQGRSPYLAPYGGSSPTGALGYAFAMQEFMQQGFHADCIVFASSSGGTQAGMVLGARLFGYKGRLLGISIDEPQTALQAHCAKLASDSSEKIGPRIDFSPDEVKVNADYCSAGYGVLTDTERDAVRLFATMEGLLLDPVYTGRAAGGMLDLIRKNFFRKDESVLFWHTGGSTALFADIYLNKI
jgi:D-cysteine desulfhydrase